jgi:phage gp29-like protein
MPIPTDVGPPQRKWLELPIVVQNTWDNYTQVAEAIDQLTIAGNYLQASLLVQSLFSDDRVSACLNTRTNAIFGLPMEFKYPGQDQPEDDATAEMVALKEHIRDVVESEWEDIMPGAAAREWFRWGVMMNLGVSEIVWRWVESDEPDGMQLPTLKVWNTQFCYWRWDTRSFWINHTGGTAEIHPGDGHWVMLCPFGHNHGWLYGLVNSLGWLYLDRIFLKRNWARANEKFSLGIMKAFMPADANENDKGRFVAAIENLPHEATVSLPVTDKGNKFDLEMVKTDTATGWETFLNTKRSIDTDIAVCILGQNLSTEISGGSGGTGGSKAAAKVHNDIREDILKADVEILATTIKTQILTPLVARNWGHVIQAMGGLLQDFVPDVTWQIEPPEDKQQDTEAIAALAQALPVLSAAGVDVGALLERFDIPMLEGRRARTKPPPDGDVNERPGFPGWGLDFGAPVASDDPAKALRRTGHKLQPLRRNE